jgi:hypothetical protein
MKTFGWICTTLLLVVGVTVLDKVLFVTDTVDRSVKGVITKTLDSDNVLQNYEYFKQSNQDYVAARTNVEVSKKKVAELKETPRKDMDWSDKQELTKAETTLQGQIAYVNQLVADYNAKSQMQNRSLFKTKDLPFQLETITE